MLGMIFLILDDNRQILAHGVVTQKLTDSKYLCTFMREPQSSRICDIEQMQNWHLFPNLKAMSAFTAAHTDGPEDS